eukprot:TRINITY_DN24845_c0_g1_i1.p1 TRINITY_DN24845_c0_g1~~TRINITY_DN24845_c0_g1_i1.p1  ORF type:complete len:357 (-),score=51.11 TRINITY_DN24845_c0_g1_i1:207-1214(-)
MSSEKDLNRNKWQNKKRNKRQVNLNTYRKGSSTINKNISPHASTLADYVQLNQTNDKPEIKQGGLTSYLDGGGFSLDMDEMGVEGEVLYNSQGFNFEQLLEDAQADGLFGRRSWGLSQDFEYSQPIAVPDCQVLQVDLKGLGQALDGLPIHELLGIDQSYFDTNTQKLQAVSASTRIDSQQSFSSNDEVVETNSIQCNDDLKESRQLNLSHVEQLYDHKLSGNLQNQETLRLKQQDDDLNALLDRDVLLNDDTLLTSQSNNTETTRLKQQEDDLDALLGGDLLFNYDNQLTSRSKNQKTFQKKQKIYGQNGIQRSNESQTMSGDLDDELDRLLQL